MRSEYLDSINNSQEKHGTVMGAVYALYGWSTVDMVSKFRDTGRFTVPWSFNTLGVDMVGNGIMRRTKGFDPYRRYDVW